MVEIREVTEDSAVALAAVMEPDGDLVALRLARGCRCFGAWLGGDLAGYGWLSNGPEWIGELDLEIRPGAGEAYAWNCLTLPRQRRKGVFGALVRDLVARARSERLSRLWIGSVAMPAEKAIPQAGFVPVLQFSSEVLSDIRWLKVRSAPGVEPELLAAGREALAVGGRPLRLDTWMRRAHPRRH